MIKKGLSYIQFKGGSLFDRWKDVLAHKRNRAVHAGVASFMWNEALEAIGIAKETVIFLDQRVPELAHLIDSTLLILLTAAAPTGIIPTIFPLTIQIET